jgi:hypothetical protein
MLQTMSGPIIALMVDRKMERALQEAFPRAYFVVFQDWVELAFYDLEAAPRAFIVDPLLLDDEHRLPILGHLGQRTGAPVVLYCRMSPDLARILLELGRSGLRWIMLRGMDDRPDRMRLVLAAAVSQGPRPARR